MGMSLGINRGMALNNTGGAAAWSPSALLAGASQLAYYDPSDLSTLFQDSAGTTPVTADGQSVRRVLDKSGNGNHLTQANIANAPLYKTSGGLHWLQFDGTDDFLVSAANLDPGAVDKVQVFAGMRKLSDSAFMSIVEHGSNIGVDPGLISLAAPQLQYRMGSSGNIVSLSQAVSSSNYVSPTSNIISGLADISGDRSTLRVDGVQVAQNTGDQGTGNYLAYPLYIGRRGGILSPFNGNLYGLIVRFAPDNLATLRIQTAERWMATKTGIQTGSSVTWDSNTDTYSQNFTEIGT